MRIEVGGNDSVTGESFGEIAGRSRSMHKTQGFGNFGGRGGGPRTASFQILDGAPATNDIMDGIDTTWSRFDSSGEIGKLTSDAIAHFDSNDPAASVPALLTIRSRLAKLADNHVVDLKRRQLDRILQACLGLEVATTVPQAEVVPGETLKLHHTATVRSGVPVRWLGVRYPSVKRDVQEPIALHENKTASREISQALPANTPLSQPYWLREDHPEGTYSVDDPNLIGRPENPPVFPVEQIFEVGGQTLAIPDEPVQLMADRPEAQAHRRLAVIPPVSLKLPFDVALFAPSATRPVEVDVTAARPDVSGMARLEAPVGWKVVPATQPFHLAAAGDHAKVTFTVTAPPEPASATFTARR